MGARPILLRFETNAMPMYTEAEKIATNLNMKSLLETQVLVDGQPSSLKAQMTNTDATILLFVRNGA